ncbi:anti-repressor Ant [Gordonia phage Phistory]|uniref:Antirepressor n=1 Tax=Gordonia phage Phistory TaxID=2301694 RepID=A0A385DZ03_9CAUD|nr:anti-repressor Ant [Gordonia phage Phistory]AXQ64763.1 antirepressor [Gordonia phage Phistory]
MQDQSTAHVVPFNYEGAELRTLLIDDTPWFVTPDACRMLELRDTSSALKMVDDDDKMTLRRSDTPQFFEGIAAQVQMLTVVNESGMWSLIFQSNKDKARKVRRWVTGEVLPAIRRTGSYNAAPAPALEGPELFARALVEAQHMLSAKDEQIAELAPKAEVADRILTADGDLDFRDAAQSLTRAGIKLGRQRLFTLCDQHYDWIFRSQADGKWRVRQSAIEAGWMTVIPQSHYHPKTGVLVLDPPQPRITPKGLQRILSDHGGKAA